MTKKIIAIVLIILTISALCIVPAVLETSGNVDDNENSSSVNSEVEESSNEEAVTTEQSDDSSIIDSDEPIIDLVGDTIVAKHGQLSVDGSNIVDKNGESYQLRGMSTHGIQWFPKYVSLGSFKTLRDDWGVNCIRLAMYTQSGIYQGEKDEELVRKGIDYCIELGLYVIVDWHILGDNNPNTNKTEALRFFGEISEEYSSYNNIIYEICNEPNGNVTWEQEIKPYCEDVIAVIRQNDKDNIIIAGTPTWSQEIDKVINSRLSDDNTVYALHFYADTHKQWLRDKAATCIENDIPIFVSEFGICDASGNGANNYSEAEIWLEFLDENNISYINWNLSDKNESSASFNSGASGDGNWLDDDLSAGGKWYRDWLREKL